MKDTGRKLLIGSGFSLLALVAVKVADVVSSIVVARLLGPENLGMFAIIKYLLEFLCIFTVLGIPTAMVKFLAESDVRAQEHKSTRAQVVSTSFVSMLIPTFLVSVIIFILSDRIAQNIYHEPRLGFLIKVSVITLFAMSLFMFGSSILQGIQEIKKLSLTRIINSIISLPIVIILVYYGGLKGAVVSKAIIAVIGVGIVGWILFHESQLTTHNSQLTTHNSQFTKRLLNLSCPIFLSGLVMTPALWIITTRLSVTQGFAQVGLFNVAYALMQIILFIPIAVGIPLVPKVSELNSCNKEELRSTLLTSLYIVGLISLIIAMLFSVFSKNIILLLYGPEYLPAWEIVILLSASAFLMSLGSIVGYYLIGVSKMWIGVLFNLIWFTCVIGSSIPLVELYGAKGIGIAYIGSYIILTGVIFWFIKKMLSISLVSLISLVISGLLFIGLSYLGVKYFYDKAFLPGAILLLVLFLVIEYSLCPVKSQVLGTVKNILGFSQNPVERS